MVFAAVLVLALGVALTAGLGASPGQAIAGAPTVLPEVPATPTDLAARLASNSPELAADPTNPRFVVLANRVDSPIFSCSLQLSGDGGRSWLTAQPVLKLPRGVDECYGPQVAFSSTGRLYFLFVGLKAPGNTPVGAYLVTSDDRGRTFTSPRQLLSGTNFQLQMAIDRSYGGQGRLYLIWQHAASLGLGGFAAPGNPIMFAYSNDGGDTFSAPIQISDAIRPRVTAPALALGAHGVLHVLYYDLGGDYRDYQGLAGAPWRGKWSLVMTSSTDGGRRFGPGAVVDSNLVPPGRVQLILTMPPASVATGSGGWVYVAWDDDRNGDWDVFFRRSDDGGLSWGKPLRVNDDPLHDGSAQYLPHISVAPGGRIDAIWYDRRSNPQNRGNDVYYAFSTSRGATFSPNVKLTPIDFDSRIGQVYNIPSAIGPPVMHDLGSRLALLSERDHAVAAWTDTSNSATAPPSQDIDAARIVFRLAGGDTGLRVLGAALALAGLLALGILSGIWRTVLLRPTPADGR